MSVILHLSVDAFPMPPCFGRLLPGDYTGGSFPVTRLEVSCPSLYASRPAEMFVSLVDTFS